MRWVGLLSLVKVVASAHTSSISPHYTFSFREEQDILLAWLADTFHLEGKALGVV
jgi:hypothetical protein